MTKKQIVTLLSSLTPSQVKDLHVVYHNTHGSFSSLYDYRTESSAPNDLLRVILTAYKLRACIKYVRIVYVDSTNMMHFEEFVDDRFKSCYNLCDFLLINDLI